MVICDKFSCNHCEKIFNSKNKLYDYIRSHECVATSSSAAKSISFHKFDLSALIHVENTFSKTLITSSTTSSFIYRAISFSSPIYELYKKLYLTVIDLYIRFVSLSKSSFTITRIIIMLFIIFMQNLYEKFYNKKKLVMFTNKSFKQYAIRQNLEHVVFERFGSIRSLLKSMSKSIAQGLIVQQQRHIKPIKHGALPDICIDDVRRHTMSPVDLAVVVKTPARYRTYGIPAEKDMNTSAEHMRCSNKV